MRTVVNVLEYTKHQVPGIGFCVDDGSLLLCPPVAVTRVLPRVNVAAVTGEHSYRTPVRWHLPGISLA